MKDFNSNKDGKRPSASFVVGAVALLFLIVGYQAALFIQRHLSQGSSRIMTSRTPCSFTLPGARAKRLPICRTLRQAQRPIGTGKSLLVYQTHPERHLVQETALWRTDRRTAEGTTNLSQSLPKRSIRPAHTEKIPNIPLKSSKSDETTLRESTRASSSIRTR